MLNESRIQELIEEILDSDNTPEVVCAANPELLDEVKARWQVVRRVQSQIDGLFPPVDAAIRADRAAKVELPRIDGYDMEGELGRGGMGVVFKARHRRLNRFVALKTMRAGFFADPIETGRFRREAEAVAAIRHPNIVEIHDVGESAGLHYLTMELLEGGSLAQRLAGKPQPERQSAELIAILASAVQFAHQCGFIHRDLKPANILLTGDGIPKIADFGLVLPIQSGSEYTASGARIGSPSYMAPEQAMGQSHASGPGADVYALGVILYEMLTGRPPFAAETAAELERQVIGDDPPPPSRLNVKVPRDLETICLKCLEKKPVRRYASAQDLADDLNRFLGDMPVLARPVGIAPRAWKWVRRRPALAALLAALLVLLATAGGTAAWLQHERNSRRTVARHVIESEIPRACELGREEKWRDAARILSTAERSLAFADSDELGKELARASADLQFAQQLEEIRQRHAFTAPYNRARWLTDNRECAKEYSAAFAAASLDVDNAEDTATNIGKSELGPQIIAALDLWALVAWQEGQQPLARQLLRIARLADPDPAWRDRFRDLDVWNNQQKLIQLADEAISAMKPPPAHGLAITGQLLYEANAKPDGVRLLRESLLRRPGDFWLNWEMGDALYRDGKFQDAVEYFRIVLALRPKNPWSLDRLSTALYATGQLDESLAISRQAVELAPTNAVLRYNYAVSLLSVNRLDEAQNECRRILETDPNCDFAALELGVTYTHSMRPEIAIPIYRRVTQISPRMLLAWYNLGRDLMALGRDEEAAAAFEKAVQIDSNYFPAHLGLARTSLQSQKYETAAVQFRSVIRSLDQFKAKLAASYAIDPDTVYREAWPGLAESLCCLGRFAAARQAARQALEMPEMQVQQRAGLRKQLQLCERLVVLEGKLQGTLAEKDLPDDVNTRLALAQWFHEDARRQAASARLYCDVFARQPSLADDWEPHNRFRAACAAVQAGCGIGDDASKLDDDAKARWRRQALVWLQADRDACSKRIQGGASAERSEAVQHLVAWRRSEELACLHDEAELAKLPASESTQWRRLWAEADALAALDPRGAIELARVYAARKQWTLAAEAYARLMKNTPTDDGEVWFEFAAVQLLAGDERGYRATCQRMLTPSVNAFRLRPFLVARACTLAPGSVDDLSLALKLSKAELNSFEGNYWSLTEQGALCCRTKQERDAIPLFERSMKAEPKRGCAVLNWLWLAIARQRLGEAAEARQRLEQAAAWLDSLGNKMPLDAVEVHLDLHNWLEANVLRQEAERTISTAHSVK